MLEASPGSQRRCLIGGNTSADAGGKDTDKWQWVGEAFLQMEWFGGCHVAGQQLSQSLTFNSSGLLGQCGGQVGWAVVHVGRARGDETKLQI